MGVVAGRARPRSIGACLPTLGLRQKRLCGLWILLVVALFMALLPHARAYADELADVREEIKAKTDEMNLLVEEIAAEKAMIAEIETRMETLLSDLAVKQQAHARLQDEASKLARVMYKDGDDFNVLVLLEKANSLPDFLRRLDMRDQMLSASSDMLDELHRAQDELDEAYRQASDDKDKQRSLLTKMEEKRTKLDKLVAELKKYEKQLDIEQKAELAQAAASAHKVAQTFETNLKADGTETDEEGWRTGIASAYGGSSDKSTPNPGTTATGTRCDDWSVGVAVPIAWGPQDYYGKYVEISYEGRSIIAPVVDCGGMGGGSRALDLQPGVFKAFGAKTCADWGLREVYYRFL